MSEMDPKWQSALRDWAEALIFALLLALFIRSFVVQAFKIPSGSMLQTLQIGDQLLVNKFIYGIKVPFTDIQVIPVSDPQHGDVVVFEYPNNPSIDYIKRVIGVPGDVIEVVDNHVIRNGVPIDEPYISGLPGYNPRSTIPAIKVPEGKYFVLGDNRNNSQDSRYWGYVDRSAFVGKAWRIYWSWESLSNIRFGRIGRLVE